jgi:hypothetical protein
MSVMDILSMVVLNRGVTHTQMHTMDYSVYLGQEKV